MKELLTYIARNLVEKPDEVSVNEIDSGRSGGYGQGHWPPGADCERDPRRGSLLRPAEEHQGLRGDSGLRALPYQEYPVTSCPPDSCAAVLSIL